MLVEADDSLHQTQNLLLTFQLHLHDTQESFYHIFVVQVIMIVLIFVDRT